MVWKSGTKLQRGKYLIQDVLGEGGFGITYKAKRTQSNQLVVIKTPSDNLKSDPEYEKFVAKFARECQRLVQLLQMSHPSIVRVQDYFEEKGIPCIVMDYIPGENLYQRVERLGSLPEAEALSCIRQIAEALTVAHQSGFTHRDAHPGNIILQASGRAILIDFGIAKGLTQSTQNLNGSSG
jgi:serine/threonine protein kinase